MNVLDNDAPVRKSLRAKDLPRSWNITVSGGPDTPITVIIEKDAPRERRLASYVGAAKGAHGSGEDVDEHIRRLRDE